MVRAVGLCQASCPAATATRATQPPARGSQLRTQPIKPITTATHQCRGRPWLPHPQTLHCRWSPAPAGSRSGSRGKEGGGRGGGGGRVGGRSAPLMPRHARRASKGQVQECTAAAVRCSMAAAAAEISWQAGSAAAHATRPPTAARPIVFSSMSERMSSGVATYRPSSLGTYRSSTSK